MVHCNFYLAIKATHFGLNGAVHFCSSVTECREREKEEEEVKKEVKEGEGEGEGEVGGQSTSYFRLNSETWTECSTTG